MNSRSRMPSPAMVVALVALFVALAGGAYAASKAPKNSVVSRSIKNGQVKSADLANGGVKAADLGAGSVGAEELAAGAVRAGALADGAVGSAALTDGAVAASKLAPGSVGVGALADGAVTGAKLAPGSVDGVKIADGGVGTEDIGESAVGSEELGTILRVLAKSAATTDADGVTNGGAVGIATANAVCPAGGRVLSGGTRWVDNTNNGTLDGNLYIQQEGQSSPTGWIAEGVVDIGAAGSVRLQVEAYCLLPGGPAS